MATASGASVVANSGTKIAGEKMDDESRDSAKMEDYGSEDEEGSSEDGGPSKRAKNGDDDDDDDDDDGKGGDDGDGDENSDTASHRQSKRKPSKSRIKRILPQDLPAHSSLSPDAPYPYLNPDQLAVAGGQQMTPVAGGQQMTPPMASLAQSYLEGRSGQRRPSQSGDVKCGYQCNICGKEFRVPSRYESHMLSHSKGKPFCCDICGKLFASQQKLEVHKPVHGRNRKDAFTCPTCGRECTNWRAYLYHVAKHTSNGGKKHACQVCGRQFHAAQRLRNHMKSHVDGKNFCCLVCGKLFESQKRLDTHSIIHDVQRREPFRCVDCGKVYEDWRAFKQHMKTHGSDGVIYRCEICSAQFYTQYEKEKHKRVHTSDKRYQCQHCSKCFRSQAVLNVHERKHLGQKGHECTICGREFARNFSLKQHMKMHVGEEEFMCHLCGRTFSRGDELSSHTAEHAKEREFSCDQCGKSFAFKDHHHRHLVLHAAGQPFSCGVCGKMFDTHSHLQTHLATHRGAGRQEFNCLACSDVFETQLELEAHAHSHGKSPPYVCGLCGKMFAEQRYFRQHMKRHTARALKEKMQAQGLATPPSSRAAKGGDSNSSTKTSPGSLGHTCHMCGQSFSSRQALILHIEDHKRSGLLMYFNLMDGQMRAAQQSQRRKAGLTPGGQDSSDEESDTASDSEASEEPDASKLGAGKGQGVQLGSRGQGQKGQSSSLTAIAERAMALRMQPPSALDSHINAVNNATSSSSRPSVIKSDATPKGKGMDDSREQGSQDYFSSPVFPSQMTTPTTHATPYHAAAQPFQQSQGAYLDSGSSQGPYSDISSSQGTGDLSQHFGSTQQGLPSFNDFRRQFGFQDNNSPPFPNNFSSAMTSTPQFANTGPATSYPTSYSSSSMMPQYDTSPPVSSYAGGKMPVFPGMPPQAGHGDVGMNGQGMSQTGDGQQFEPMLQFQPLGS